MRPLRQILPVPTAFSLLYASATAGSYGLDRANSRAFMRTQPHLLTMRALLRFLPAIETAHTWALPELYQPAPFLRRRLLPRLRSTIK